jgi:asparagine synthase (glutamine-hydrolysing)
MLPHDPDLRLVDIESYLPGDLLPKADIASMAVSLELRAPFLDHHVVELGLALPPELARGKEALRRAFGAELPPETSERGKTGFGVPLDSWFRGELRPLAEDLLLGGADRGLFRRDTLERLLREHTDRRADHGHRLWCLCALELWQRRWVDAGDRVLSTSL